MQHETVRLAVDAVTAAATDFPEAAAAFLEAVDFDLDDPRLDETLDDLLPLLYRRALDHRSRPSSPKGVALTEIIEQLKNDYLQSWAGAQLLLSRARPLLDELERRGSRPVMLKGAVMLSSAYHRNLGVRPIADLDVLVEPDYVDDIVAWALDNGWRIAHDLDLRDVRLVHHAVDLEFGRDGALDIHWSLLANSRDPDRDRALMENARPAKLGSIDIRVPSPTRHLLHTLSHVKPSGVRHVVDVILIIQRDGDAIDWEVLFDDVVARRVIGSVQRTVRQVTELHPGVIPAAFIARLDAAPRHWSDYPFHGMPFSSRRDVVRRLAAEVNTRSRGASIGDRARITQAMVARYGQRHDLAPTQLARSFVRRGHRDLDIELD